MAELIYLACPYSDKDPLVEDVRYDVVTKVAAALIVVTGCEVFSPVTHSHLINRHACRYNDGNRRRHADKWRPTYDFWLRFDYRMLDISDYLYILQLTGWDRSEGVRLETERFLKQKPFADVRFIKPEDYI